MNMPIKVLYHDNCFDGCHSAAVAKSHFGSGAEYIPVNYVKPNTDFSNSDIYFLDIVYPPEHIQILLDQGNSIHVIDHHTENVMAMKHLPVDSLVYDPNESGASLAWRNFFPGQSLPMSIVHARDYDLWKFEHPNTDPFVAHLGIYPIDVDRYLTALKMSSDEYEEFVKAGQGMLAYKNNIVKEISKEARPISLRGFDGHIINAPYALASEVGNEVVSTYNDSFAFVWSERSDGLIKVSIRGIEGDAPLQIAKSLGGSGHNKSSGAVIERSAFNKLIARAEPKKAQTSDCCPH